MKQGHYMKHLLSNANTIFVMQQPNVQKIKKVPYVSFFATLSPSLTQLDRGHSYRGGESSGENACCSMQAFPEENIRRRHCIGKQIQRIYNWKRKNLSVVSTGYKYQPIAKWPCFLQSPPFPLLFI